MRSLALLSFWTACVGPSDVAAGSGWRSETGVDDGISPISTSSTMFLGSTAGSLVGATTWSTTSGASSDPPLDAETLATPSLDPSDLSDDPETNDSDDPSADPPPDLPADETAQTAACGGRVPVECLLAADVMDASTCPGEIGGCQYHDCFSERQRRSQLDRWACLARVCDVEPTMNLTCLERWFDLERECFADHCDPAVPYMCSQVWVAAYDDCRVT